MEIKIFEDKYHQEIIKLVLKIQNEEAGIGLSLDEQPDLKAIRDEYLNKGGTFLVAVDDSDGVIGTIGLINKGGGFGILKKFFVRNDCRRCKIGWRLYRRLIAFAAKHDYRTIILDTPSSQRASHEFYERNGFERIERYDLPIDYDYPDRDSLLYIKRIDCNTEA